MSIRYHNIIDGVYDPGDHTARPDDDSDPTPIGAGGGTFPSADELDTGDVVYWDDDNLEWRRVEGTKQPGYVLALDADMRLRWTDIGVVVDPDPEPPPPPPPPPPAGDVTAPATPTGLSIVKGDRLVLLNWADNGESDLAAYSVYWAAASGGPFVLKQAGVQVSALTVSGLTNGTAYWFKVSALDTTGNESAQTSSVTETPSLPDASDTTAPSTPTGLTATAADRQIVLDWADSAATDFASFKVYRALATGGPYSLIATRTVSNYTNTGLTNGIEYFYKVSAVDQTGNESAQSSADSDTPAAGADTTPPPIPTGLTATPGNGQIVLNWSDSPASDWLNFKVYRAPTTGGTYVLIATRTVSDYTNTGLTNGEDWFYKVSAVDTAGNESAQSLIVSETPAAPPTGVVLWRGDMEGGNLSQWTGFTPTGTGRAEVVTTPVHGGSYAMALHANATNGVSAIRARMEDNLYGADPNNLPPDGYYSVWIRTPTKLDPVNNVFQWKQGVRHALVTHTGSTDYNSQTRCLLHFIRLDYISANNNHQLVLRSKINQSTGAWAGSAGTTALADSGAARVTINTWHHIECRYKWDETGAGQITSWLDGVQWCNVTNLYTQLKLIQVSGQPNPGATTYVTKPRQWTINNYMTEGSGTWDPMITVIYFDDAAVATSQVGP